MTDRFEFLFRVITSTPWWVWGIFAYLMMIGIKSMRTHSVSLPKLFIMPAVLIGLRYKTFNLGGEAVMLAYIACLLLGCTIGFLLGQRTHVKVLRASTSVELPGNYLTICIIFSFFCIKYVFGYLNATAPELAIKYSMIETSISLVFSGYFLGRGISYLGRYLKNEA